MQTPYWQDDIDAARRTIVELDPALARAHAQTPAFEWRRRIGGFEGLFHMIVDQQVSLASTRAQIAAAVASETCWATIM